VTGTGFKSSVFYSRPSRIVAAILAAIAVVSVVGSIINSGPRGIFALLPGILVIAVAYFVFWRPMLAIYADHIEVVNPFRTHVVPFSRISAVSIQWNLRVEVDGKSLSVWAVPRTSNAGQVVSARRDPYGRPDYDGKKQFESRRPLGNAEAAAEVIMSRLGTPEPR